MHIVMESWKGVKLTLLRSTGYCKVASEHARPKIYIIVASLSVVARTAEKEGTIPCKYFVLNLGFLSKLRDVATHTSRVFIAAHLLAILASSSVHSSTTMISLCADVFLALPASQSARSTFEMFLRTTGFH